MESYLKQDYSSPDLIMIVPRGKHPLRPAEVLARFSDANLHLWISLTAVPLFPQRQNIVEVLLNNIRTCTHVSAGHFVERHFCDLCYARLWAFSSLSLLFGKEFADYLSDNQSQQEFFIRELRTFVPAVKVFPVPGPP